MAIRLFSNAFLVPALLSASLALSCGEDGGGGGSDTEANDGPTSKGCSAAALPAGDSTVTLMHGGVERTYLLHVPASYTSKEAVPLVVDIHGLMSNATQQQLFSGFREKSDKENFIVANPQGLNNSWNGGELCCGTSQMNKVDDEGFIRALVTEIKNKACVDNKRVYVTGLSNGGAMAHLMACRAADVFAAAAPISMGNGTVPCQPARPIAVFMARSTGDTLVPYDGGGFINTPSAQADLDQWKTLNGCTGEAKTTLKFCKTYDQCNAGVEVSQCTLQISQDEFLGGHLLYPPSAAQGLVLADAIWDMFKRQTLP